MRHFHYGALLLTGLIACGLVGAAAQDLSGQREPADIGGIAGGRFLPGGRGAPGAPPPQVRITAERLAAMKALYVPPTSIPVPADNLFTPEKIALGKKLFFDPILSANGKLACASCHDARRGFSGTQALSVGVKGERLARHTPTILNLAWSQSYFWDGRAKSLEQQAVMPIADAKEMGMPHDILVPRLKEDAAYNDQFQRVFPGEGASAATIGKALAAFERTLIFDKAPFDRWIAGEESAISDSAKRGFIDFNTRAGCAQCHSGWNFTDDRFHDIGLPDSDVGRFGIEAIDSLKHSFKTPGLRNIAERAPYMHNGRLGSLGAVLQFYDDGFVRRSTLSPEMRRIRGGLGRDMIAFLQTLSTPPSAELVSLQNALDEKTR